MADSLPCTYILTVFHMLRSFMKDYWAHMWLQKETRWCVKMNIRLRKCASIKLELWLNIFLKAFFHHHEFVGQLRHIIKDKRCSQSAHTCSCLLLVEFPMWSFHFSHQRTIKVIKKQTTSIKMIIWAIWECFFTNFMLIEYSFGAVSAAVDSHINDISK